MSKQEYMKKLAEIMQEYDKDFREELLANYDEHFEAGLRSGKTEEEICQELGDISNIRAEIEEMLGDMDIRTHELDKFTAIEATEQNNIKTIGKVSHLELSLNGMNVKLMPSRDEELHVYTKDGQPIEGVLQEDYRDGTYIATELMRHKINGRNLLERMVNNLFPQETTLIVEIPKDSLFIQIKTGSGDVEVWEVDTQVLNLECTSGDILIKEVHFDTALLKTKSGEMDIQKVKGENTVFESSSGDIKLKQLEGKEISVTATSGDIKANACQLYEIKLESTSGDNSLQDVVCQKAAVSSTSGDVNLTDCELNEMRLSSTSGDIEGRFFAQNLDCKTSSGDIDIELERRGKKVFAQGRTGSGRLRLPNEISREEVNGNPQEVIFVTVNGGSGDITIK